MKSLTRFQVLLVTLTSFLFSSNASAFMVYCGPITATFPTTSHGVGETYTPSEQAFYPTAVLGLWLSGTQLPPVAVKTSDYPGGVAYGYGLGWTPPSGLYLYGVAGIANYGISPIQSIQDDCDHQY